MKRLIAGLLGTAAVLAAIAGLPSNAAAQNACTIALIPGLTTDAFYITMRKGAEMAAKAVGCELIFQGAPDFNPVTQVPVLQAVIASFNTFPVGGGASSYFANAAFSRCVFTRNTAVLGGGGLYVEGSQPVISNCIRLTTHHKMCLLALGSFGGPNSRGIFPSVARLA